MQRINKACQLIIPNVLRLFLNLSPIITIRVINIIASAVNRFLDDTSDNNGPPE